MSTMIPFENKSGRPQLLCHFVWTPMDDRGAGRSCHGVMNPPSQSVISCSASSPSRQSCCWGDDYEKPEVDTITSFELPSIKLTLVKLLRKEGGKDDVSHCSCSSVYVDGALLIMLHMAEAIVGILIPQLATHVEQLIRHLMDVKEIKKHNNLLVEEITNFADSLQTNLQLVESKLPEKVSGKALDSLLTELKKGNEHMKECLDKGKFKQYWSAKETKSSLESLRQKLMTSFQMAFLITSLDVALDGHQNNQNFQEKMLLISRDHRANSAEVRDLLRPLVAGQNQQMRRQDRYMQTVNRDMEEIRAVLHQISAGQVDSVTEKFWNDVVAAISQSASDSPGESSGDKEGTDKYTDDLDSLRTEITQLKEGFSKAEKEATGKISFLAAELESEKTKNAAISAKLKKELASALNQGQNSKKQNRPNITSGSGAIIEVETVFVWSVIL
ncbi:hypothetical protein R1flu_003288 [Riccia fluitans]|uniref:Uncharacterized protein n=1 Tax=Riccia fluitans TaxID=41844 RepID=A0ABD1Y8L0_9MARC